MNALPRLSLSVHGVREGDLFCFYQYVKTSRILILTEQAFENRLFALVV